MIASYGYEDGSGVYYITIDTGACASCEERPCVAGCPAGVLAPEIDDYDDEVVAVAEGARRRLKELCSMCKGAGRGRGGPVVKAPDEDRAAGYEAHSETGGTVTGVALARPPCVEACPHGAIVHSW